jgi:hypothetical protein
MGSLVVVGFDEDVVEVADDVAEVYCKSVSRKIWWTDMQAISYCQRLPSWRPLQGPPY